MIAFIEKRIKQSNERNGGQKMDTRAIGILDSGVGGLTALTVVQKLMPAEDIIYFGDTLNSPYGEKSPEEIVSCVNFGTEFLESKGAKVILFACGTASSYIDKVNCNVPIIGIIDTSCKKAIETSSSMKIGILATSATINSGAYKQCILNLNPECSICEKSCPELASTIENGHIGIGDRMLMPILSEYLECIDKSDVDTLILGCTHYPIIEGNIRNILKNKNIRLINPGFETANTLKNFLEKRNMCTNKNGIGNTRYFVSGEKSKFCDVAEVFLGHSVKNSVWRCD